MTTTNLPKFTPTAEQITAAERVFLCMANVRTIEPTVTAYQREILARGQWKKANPDGLSERTGRDGSVITDPKEAWLMSEDDFALYDAECKKARVASGLLVEKPEHCPLLVAEEALRQAKRQLVDALESVSGVTADQIIRGSMKNYDRFVELSLQMLAPHCGDAKTIMDRELAEAVDVERPRG